MTAPRRTKIVNELRLVASLLTASELAYPERMRDSIMRKVRQAYLKWIAFQFQKDRKTHQDVLDAASGKAKIPAFRTSPALSDDIILFYHGVPPQTLPWSTRLRDAIGTELDKKSYTILDKFFSEGAKRKDLIGLPASDLHWAISVLEGFAKNSEAGSRPTRSEAYKISQKLWDVPTGSSKSEVAYATSMLKQIDTSMSYVASQIPGGKVKGPVSKLASVTWKEDVDLSDLPEQYKFKTDLSEITVSFRIDKRVKKWSGTYNFATKTLTLYVPPRLPGTSAERAIRDSLTVVGNTAAHELQHMVQKMLQDAYGKKAGTRYKKGQPLPGNDPKERVAHVSKTAYPRATKQERYFLTPEEFYPNLKSAIVNFKLGFNGVLKKPTAAHFKQYVGLLPVTDQATSRFFLALKANDKPRYKKAVSEAWAKLSDFVKPQRLDPNIQRIARDLESKPVGHVLTTPGGELILTKRQDGDWHLEKSNNQYDNLNLAHKIWEGVNLS